MFIRSLFSCFFALFFTTSVFSQIGGTNTYGFLSLPVSARVTALGGDNISTKDNDYGLALSNPALLTDSMHNNVALNYFNYFADVKYGYVAYAKKVKPKQTISVGLQYLNYGNFTSADEIGNINGTFGGNDMSLNISYARPVVDSNLTAGVTLKTIYSNLNSYTSLGSAIDLGGVYVFQKYGFTLAALVKNAGVQWVSYTPGNRESLPFEMQLGATKKLKHAPIQLSMVYQNIQKWNLVDSTNDSTGLSKLKNFADEFMRHLVIGAELKISKNFFIRAGYNYRRQQELKVTQNLGFSGFSFGFGLRVYKFQLSYAHAVYSLAGSSNNFSIVFNLNSFHQKQQEETTSTPKM